jgi:hypothetical protein
MCVANSATEADDGKTEAEKDGHRSQAETGILTVAAREIGK